MRARWIARSTAQQVVFAAGELDRLGAMPAAQVAGQVLLCASPSATRSGTVERIREGLGGDRVVVFDQVRAHVPEGTVNDARTLAEQAAVEMVIGLGGGSALGTAKAVTHALIDAGRSITLMAVPTTYAGSEMTPVYGVTRKDEGRKVTVTEPRIMPGLVIYDPELTLDLPPEVTAGTGINALAHCIEGAYSRSGTPLTMATALRGAATIYRWLPACMADGADLTARTHMLDGAYLGGVTIAGAGMAIHHGICHVLGGTAGVPHGVANAIMLPHALRFNLPTCTAELAAVGRAIGVSDAADTVAAERLVGAVEALVETLGLPRRLRDAGVGEGHLGHLAEMATASGAVRANPRPASQSDLEAILHAAW